MAPPAPYAYEYVTDETLASWQDGGRQSLLGKAIELDEVEMGCVLQELVTSALDSRLDPTEAGSIVRQMVSDLDRESETDVPLLLLNIISLIDEPDVRKSASDKDSLRKLVAAVQIDPQQARYQLDIPLLKDLALVRDQFDRMRNRKTTNILYRQANFNLLREETEGYAKLLTEYFNTAAEAGDVRANPEIALDAFQRIKALVGAFDLDVGRVLDITLDISANVIVKDHEFVIAFYRCSSWWPETAVPDGVRLDEDVGFSGLPAWALADPVDSNERSDLDLSAARRSRDTRFWQRVHEVGLDAFYEIRARRVLDYGSVTEAFSDGAPPSMDSQKKLVNDDKRTRVHENRQYMRETRLLPPGGNSDAAQLLGFKLRYYASSARDEEDRLPENLIQLAALLIKIGFISLRDLYPHLYPSDDQMPEERAKLEKQKADKEAKAKPGGGMNALAMAAALTDDTIPAVRNMRSDKDRSGGATPRTDKKDDGTAKEELRPPQNQKVMLLRALLLLGALPEALFMLGRFPWLAEVDLELHPLLLRLVKQMLSRMVEDVNPLSDRGGVGKEAEQLFDTCLMADGKMSFTPRALAKSTKWLGAEKFDDKEGREFRCYYSDWMDCIPVCQTTDDVFSLCDTFLGYVGVKVGQDPSIYGTLLRLAKRSLTDDFSEHNRSRWLELMRRLLVPALSLGKHNPGLTQEVYELLMFYPITTRYSIYAEWFTGKTSRLPDMRVAFEHNRAEVKDVIRRVTNENSRKMGRALGKVALASPGVVMMFMINQLESYSNMIPSLVECTKYFSMLAYDVLTWCLINSLSGQGRDRMQGDGMLTSPWLQALSQFVASLFARYTHINPSPILQYLASELRAGHSTDLEMFEQLLTAMAGIRSDIEFNDAQVTAMAGGEHLQTQVLQFLGDQRHARKNTAKRLIQALERPGLIGQMLISVAQERQMYPYHSPSTFMPLKVLGNNLDKVQQVFAQYLDVLKTNLSVLDFENAIPDVVSLIGDYGLEPSMAFTICRPTIAHHVNLVDEEKRKSEILEKRRRRSQEKAQADSDVEMKETGAQPTTNGDTTAPAVKLETSIEPDRPASGLDNGESQEAVSPPQPSTTVSDGSQWHPVLLPIIERLPKVLEDLASRVSIPFYVTFWTLSQSDVVVFTSSYDLEHERLKKQRADVLRDRSDNSLLATKERDRKLLAIGVIGENLTAELKGRISAYTRVARRLSEKEKPHWFSRSWTRAELDARHKALLQDCFLPRCMLSSLDAHYSFLMMKLLHEKGTPGFSTMNLLSQFFRKQKLAAIIFQCTALEAQHFGRFLNEVLKYLAAWHADSATYDKEAVGTKQKLPGFARKVDATGSPDDFLEYENFRRLLFNWHTFLNSALQLCFESGEYMHIRNGIIVLKAVVQVFPKLNFQGTGMIKQMTTLSETDSRQDLKLMALSLLGPLKNREKQWVMPQAFRLNGPAKDGKPGSRPQSARPETPQPSTDTPRLDATAPEFKPSPAIVPNGAERKESVAGVEDGEVEDEKPAVATGDSTDVKKEPAPEAPSQTEQAPTPDQAPADAQPAPPRGEMPAVVGIQNVESKAPTPIPTQPATNGVTRQASSRPPSAQPPASQPHNLPSRPESKPPNKPSPMAPGHGGSEHLPARPEVRYRQHELLSGRHPPSREHSPGSRSRARTPPPSRGPDWISRPGRNSRDDSYAMSRHDAPTSGLQNRPTVEASGRQDRTMRPPSFEGPRSDKAAFLPSVVSTPQPAQPSQPPLSNAPGPPQSGGGDDNFRVNPQRMAQINGTTDPKLDARRDPRDERSVARSEISSGPVDDSRRPPAESPRGPSGKPEQTIDITPNGPPNGPRRGTRHGGRDLNLAAGAQESTYGRLNAPSDAPSGPRPHAAQSARNGRNFTTPHQPVNTRPTEPQMPASVTFRAPESPATSRIASQQPASDRRGSGPSTPVAEAITVHPSRLANVQGPPPIQTNVPALNGLRTAVSPTSAAPPSGPRISSRAPAGAPTGPSPTTAGPPTGPASAGPRRDPRANINAMLQANNAIPSFKGAALSRQQSMTASSAGVPATVPALASAMEPPLIRRSEPAPRQDSSQRRQDSRVELTHDSVRRSDDAQGRENGGQRHQEHDRPDRQRSSRNASRERRTDNGPPTRPPPSGTVDDTNRRGPTRDDQRLRDEYSRASQRHQRPDGQSQFQPSGNYGPAPLGWHRSGPDDGRRSNRGSGQGDDFRGPRRESERRDGGRGQMIDESLPENRKRRLEESASSAEKRRRGG